MPVAELQPKAYLEAGISAVPSYSESLAYTRWLATHHYENFHVVSALLPRRLHQDFYNVYSFCRWADDLGDEIGDPAESLRLLAWWRQELQSMYGGQTAHPVFIALQETVQRHQIPPEPFDRLIQAFEQDQTVTRYPDFLSVFNYCRNSANPVGHLVLYLCGYVDTERQRLSDFTCTGLQLANFWQDVTVDLTKDRVYIPLDLLQRHEYSLDQLYRREYTLGFRNLIKEAVEVTRGLFRQGMPLIRTVNRRLALDLELFSRGGLAILSKIEEAEYNVLVARPRISKMERVQILLRCLPRLLS